VETLQKLTRRQLDALFAVRSKESAGRGAALKSIAGQLKQSPPSALGHLTALEELGLIQRYRGKSRLTDKGHRTIEEYRRHHRVAETIFGRLGLPPAESCAAAREVDLSLSHRTVEQVCLAEGHPRVCPHGQPITPCTNQRERTN
jgi:DtxR family transcriptional regulator, Mn-dependent transcriptional regulator